MSKFIGRIKRLSHALAAVALGTSLCASNARADAIDAPYLTNIQNYTNSILAIVNQLPTYLTLLAAQATTFLAADNSSNDPVNWSSNWSSEQPWIATLSSDALTNEVNQVNLQQSLMTTFWGSANITAGTPQNLNDLNYATLLGQPLLSPDPRTGVNAALNYLTNASGLAIQYPTPGTGWRGTVSAQQNYMAFYNTITATQTYNAYVLSRLYEDSQTLSTDRSMRQQLIQQSSNSSWMSSVITNDLGWVLRQILLYTSQNYVLMDQLLQTQKQMTATLAMTNSLLIANSGFQAQTLISKAQGNS